MECSTYVYTNQRGGRWGWQGTIIFYINHQQAPPPLPFLAQGIDLDSHDSILHIYILLYLPPLLAIS